MGDWVQRLGCGGLEYGVECSAWEGFKRGRQYGSVLGTPDSSLINLAIVSLTEQQSRKEGQGQHEKVIAKPGKTKPNEGKQKKRYLQL